MIEIPSTMTRIDVRTQADVDRLGSHAFDNTDGVLVIAPREPIDLSDVLGLTWEKCGSCQRRYPDVYWADDTQWARVVGDTYAGLRCPECFCNEARNAGLDPVYETLAPPLSKPVWLIVRGGDDPMHPDWVRQLRDQAVAAGVPFALEWGEWAPSCNFGDHDREGCEIGYFDADGTFAHGVKPYECHMVRIGRDRSGCNLDGVEWDQRPEGV